MKPQAVDLNGVGTAGELAERILRIRSREVCALAAGLECRGKRALHDLRIACKRLRYALEGFASLDPSLERCAQRLGSLQDVLGDVHDRDLLLAILPPHMSKTQGRLHHEREACVERATMLWAQLEETMRALDSHRNTMGI
jgi:CHAD domain-containing protein